MSTGGTGLGRPPSSGPAAADPEDQDATFADGEPADVELVDLIPSARSLIEGMRDLGYSLESALADIVDNSIAAGATEVRILADPNHGNPRIGVADNGAAMARSDLLEAMRPSSRSPLDVRADNDLGRFGLGLKTASFSQGRRLTVVSRREGVASAVAWDLDRVADLDRWVVEVLPSPAGVPWAAEWAGDGTLVVWEKLDRIVEKASAADNAANFARRMADAIAHLELVFHRYLAGEAGLNRVSMSVNGRALLPFDPFHSSHPATQRDPVEKIHVGDHIVSAQVFTLPHHSKVSQKVWDKYAGVGGYTKNQGFYLYRQKRLIVWGTWFGLARHTELTKLTRVRIDTPTALDAEWHIDVRKSSAQPPHVVREHLRNKIEAIGASSRRVYTKRGTNLTTQNRLPVWQRVQDSNAISYRLDEAHPMFAGFAAGLNERDACEFRRILRLIQATLPLDALLADLAGSAEQVSGPVLEPDDLREIVSTTFARLIGMGTPVSEVEDIMGSAEPFRSNWSATVELLALLSKGEDDGA